MIATETDRASNEWRIVDAVTHLRAWGTGERHALPWPPYDPDTRWSIGTADDAWLRLFDARVSRRHAELRRECDAWIIHDVGSRNGVRRDGERKAHFALAPGVEVELGGVTLIAESAALVVLQAALQALLGYGDAAAGDVDRALRAVRTAARRRETLLLAGEGDLIAIAQRLHELALGEHKPFVVCDPRRRRVDSTARAAANYDSGKLALAAAAGGTLCVWQSRQPDDFDYVLDAIRDPSSPAQLIVCTHALRGEPLIASPIDIPPLAARASELDRVIDAYGADAAAKLGGAFAPADRLWIRQHESATHAQIAKAARRLVAIRSAGGSITKAAAQLDMSHGALSEWVARRTLPAL